MSGGEGLQPPGNFLPALAEGGDAERMVAAPGRDRLADRGKRRRARLAQTFRIALRQRLERALAAGGQHQHRDAVIRRELDRGRRRRRHVAL